jgi:hypothetical protein
MAFILADRVRESNIVAGTGPVSLGGAVPGFNPFAAVMQPGSTTWYAIVDNIAGGWEVGVGTYQPGSLARTSVLSSSNANQPVPFGGNVCDVFMDIPASWVSSLVASTALSVTATGSTQADALMVTADLVVCTTVAPGTGIITNPANRTKQKIYNRGANVLTVYPVSGSQIETYGVNASVSIPLGGDAEFIGNFATQVYVG